MRGISEFYWTVIIAVAIYWIIPPTESAKLTYYWVVNEKDYEFDDKVQLATCNGTILARTSRDFAEKLIQEGSGYLRDDKTVINLSACVSIRNPCRPSNGTYYCFEQVSVPLGSQDNPLVPFVSVAANHIPFGTTGIIEELTGRTLPGGDVHDGCVRVDDVFSEEKSKNFIAIDLFIQREKLFETVISAWDLSNVRWNPIGCVPKTYNLNG